MAECNEEETLHSVGGLIVPTEAASYPWGPEGMASDDRNHNWNLMLVDYVKAENLRFYTPNTGEFYFPIFPLNFTE
jgi:hypothetical protein